MPSAAERSAKSSAKPILLPIGVGLVITGLLIAALWPSLQKEIAVLRKTTDESVLGLAQAGSIPPAVSQPSLVKMLDVPTVSPLGQSSQGVGLDQSLKLANDYLHGGEGKTDRTEAEFWLRHAIKLQLSEPKVIWAMAQLGTLYAAPPGEASPDYGNARVLWEIAGANGDAVSLCFLGQLHEFGLGVPQSGSAARGYYQQAVRLGGCPGVDAALARVKE